MGFTSLVGAAAFLATTMLLSLGFYVHVGCKPQPFFKKGDNLWTLGISEAAMVRPRPLRAPQRPRVPRVPSAPRRRPQSYILFWTLFYDIVHIY